MGLLAALVLAVVPPADVRASWVVSPEGGEAAGRLLEAAVEVAEGQAEVEAVRIERDTVRVTVEQPGHPPITLVLRHPSRADEGARVLPSFAVTVEGPEEAARTAAVEGLLEGLAAQDEGAFPWKRTGPDPEDAAAGPEGGDPHEGGPAEPVMWVPDEAPARTWARETGAVGWTGIYALVAALLALVAVRRRRGGDGDGDGPPPRRWYPVLLTAFVVAQVVALGVLTDRLVDAWLPAPRAHRGTGPTPPEPPTDGEVGLYAWGESTMEGDVYVPVLDIPRLTAWALGGRLGDRPLHVDNLAVSGFSISADEPTRLYHVLAHPERFRPRVVMLYVGHNEYYNRDDLPEDPEAARREIETHYEEVIREIARRSRQAGALLVLGLPISNKAGAPPQGSQHGRDVGEADRGAAERRMRTAEEHLDAERWQAALEDADRAIALSPLYARTHWLRARALRALGREEEAREALDRAVTLDRDRQRAMPSQNAILRRICDEGLARCVDVEDRVRERYGALDDEIFLDLHHPVAAVHAMIAQGYADAIADALDLPEPRRLDPEHLPEPFDVSHMAMSVYLPTANWWLNQAGLSAERRDVDPEARRDALRRAEAALDEAARHAETATDSQLAVLSFRRALLAALRRDAEGARAHLRRAVETSPEQVGFMLDDRWYRQVLEAVLDPEEIPEGLTPRP